MSETETCVSTVREIVDLWGPERAYAAMAADLGPDVREHMPRDWARRGRIPAEYLNRIVIAAQKRGHVWLTHEFIARLAEQAATP